MRSARQVEGADARIVSISAPVYTFRRLGTVRDLYRPDFPPQIDLFNPNKYVPVQTSALQ
jgi:hypothetical protein